MKYTKGKMWAAVIGAVVNVSAAAVVASQDGKFTNDEITGIITVFVAGAGTAYAVWKTRNTVVQNLGDATVIGPEAFEKSGVISYKGENYYVAPPTPNPPERMNRNAADQG